MRVECEDTGLVLVPEDAQDRAFLNRHSDDDDLMVLTRKVSSIGFSRADNAEFVFASVQDGDTDADG